MPQSVITMDCSGAFQAFRAPEALESPKNVANALNFWIFSEGVFLGTLTMSATTGMPSITRPNTRFSPSNCRAGPGPVVMRNSTFLYPLDVLVRTSSSLAPMAKDKVPGRRWLSRNASMDTVSGLSVTLGPSIFPNLALPCLPSSTYSPGMILDTVDPTYPAPVSLSFTMATKFCTVFGAHSPYSPSTTRPMLLTSSAPHRADLSPSLRSLRNRFGHRPKSRYTRWVMVHVDASVARARRRGTTCVADMASRTRLRVEEASTRAEDIAKTRARRGRTSSDASQWRGFERPGARVRRRERLVACAGGRRVQLRFILVRADARVTWKRIACVLAWRRGRPGACVDTPSPPLPAARLAAIPWPLVSPSLSALAGSNAPCFLQDRVLRPPLRWPLPTPPPSWRRILPPAREGTSAAPGLPSHAPCDLVPWIPAPRNKRGSPCSAPHPHRAPSRACRPPRLHAHPQGIRWEGILPFERESPWGSIEGDVGLGSGVEEQAARRGREGVWTHKERWWAKKDRGRNSIRDKHAHPKPWCFPTP
eukprot:scaffold1440_cov332-Pavlova_lutheri.AAC.14